VDIHPFNGNTTAAAKQKSQVHDQLTDISSDKTQF
jgi:hypothetical protein